MNRPVTCVSTLLLAFVALRTAASAETYVTDLSGEGDRPAASVVFSGDCGEECYAARLDCDEAGSVTFNFGDVEAKIAAAAMTREAQDFTLTLGGVAHSFFITKLQYGGEMYGTWLVDGQLRDSSVAAFSEALAKAKNFKAAIGKMSLTLPVTKEVKTWAAACLKQAGG